MNSPMIRRHTFGGMFMHWFNAACWLLLLATGLGLIQNPDLQPLGQWWPDFMRWVFGGGSVLLWFHVLVALIWMGVWAVYFMRNATRHVGPFLSSIFTLEPKRDIQWMVKKNFQMILGYKAMAKLVKPLGWDGEMPEQEYYNAGQKVAAQVMLGGALVLAVTGIILFASTFVIDAKNILWVQWSITIHYIAAGLTFAILLVHIYMAAISKDERPAFWSMFSGEVPAEYAEHHHKLWYDKVKVKNTVTE